MEEHSFSIEFSKEFERHDLAMKISIEKPLIVSKDGNDWKSAFNEIISYIK